MKKRVLFISAALITLLGSCSNATQNDDETLAVIQTEFGDIKVKLYEKTAEHKKNFVKLVEEGFYDDLLFHRVIENFMIQGGDPESKNAEPGKMLGGGSLDYTVPAEFVPEYYHKRGALAAARRGGPSNPEKRSSATQFYIIQGEIFTHGKLDTLEMMKNSRLKKELLQQQLQSIENELNEFQQNNDREGFEIKVAQVREEVDSLIEAQGLKFELTDEQRDIYTTIGGYPSLDGDYTVFGEVVEGMEVVDKIAAMETDKNNRPLKNIKMEIELMK
ncbi:peptidyl-prolyl cis-trans isomerase B (cyclophilin B) [Tangfeifania diversioriginum]|uniref:peptidylprolyl isomerase n=1 Tax=Tangfeifania diversioriginum TaxID=1168035 RepID=A0A1M6LST6_9BACT|nr:peptidylprolyl isomerase [Tangfeifania diversioriginum]SHJ74239.1 peptidyl-prolyl cis-trans isomerase B (cyclophilin B) [Tangfeifania diversioriginum]